MWLVPGSGGKLQLFEELGSMVFLFFEEGKLAIGFAKIVTSWNFGPYPVLRWICWSRTLLWRPDMINGHGIWLAMLYSNCNGDPSGFRCTARMSKVSGYCNNIYSVVYILLHISGLSQFQEGILENPLSLLVYRTLRQFFQSHYRTKGF